jgi:hypothetical protein
MAILIPGSGAAGPIEIFVVHGPGCAGVVRPADAQRLQCLAAAGVKMGANTEPVCWRTFAGLMAAQVSLHSIVTSCRETGPAEGRMSVVYPRLLMTAGPWPRAMACRSASRKTAVRAEARH